MGYNTEITIIVIVAALGVLGSIVWFTAWFGSQQQPTNPNGMGFEALPIIRGPAMDAQMNQGGMGECMMGGCFDGYGRGDGLPEGVEPTVEFGLRTGFDSNGFFYEGIGDGIGGIRNPTLEIESGEVVRLDIRNGDGVIHNLVIAGMNISSEPAGRGVTVSVKFIASEVGEFEYYCSVPGHREAGMTGRLIIS